MTPDERQLLILLARNHARTATRNDRALILQLIHAIDEAPEAMQARLNEAYRREAVEAIR